MPAWARFKNAAPRMFQWIGPILVHAVLIETKGRRFRRRYEATPSEVRNKSRNKD